MKNEVEGKEKNYIVKRTTIKKSFSFIVAIVMTLSSFYFGDMSHFEFKAYAVNDINEVSSLSGNLLNFDDDNNSFDVDDDSDDIMDEIIIGDEDADDLGADENAEAPHISDDGYISYDIVTFGNFQDEPITWMVLADSDEGMFLLSEKIIECSSTDICIKWSESPIRKWLNDEFYKNSFTKEEKSAIKDTLNGNGYGNSVYNYLSGGGDTKDKIFLLSYEEAINPEYGFNNLSFATDGMRRSAVTDYAASNGVFVSTDEPFPGNGYWWLRTPGKTKNRVVCVTDTGVVYAAGYNVDEHDGGIRPALWIDKDKINLEKTSNKTNVNLSIKKTNIEYNGKIQPLITLTNSDDSIKYEFSLDGVNYTSDIPYGLNAGKYTVYCKATFADGSVTYCTVEGEIAKKDISSKEIVFLENSFMYDDNNEIVPKLILSDNGEESCRNIITEADYVLTGSLKGIKDGKYSVTAVALESGNYYGMKNLEWYIKRDTILIVGQKKNILNYYVSDNDENKENVGGDGEITKNKISRYVILEGTKYASISKDGVIKPKKEGKITVEAYTTKDGVSTKIGTSSFEIILPKFDEEMMCARYNGWSADLSKALEIPETQTVTFKANKKKIVTIDSETGVIDVHTTKSTKVTVTASYVNDNGQKVDIKGKFVIKIPQISSEKLSIKNGKSVKLKMKEVSDENIEKMKWLSSNPEVATYNEETNSVDALSDGTAVITCVIEGKSYSCDINVK